MTEDTVGMSWRTCNIFKTALLTFTGVLKLAHDYPSSRLVTMMSISAFASEATVVVSLSLNRSSSVGCGVILILR